MVLDRALKAFQEFISLESSAGILLFLAAFLAILFDNSPYHHYYELLTTLPIHVKVGMFGFSSSIDKWINDGLMTLFFLLVGLELKREIVVGELNSLRKLAFPSIAALGGMLVPIIIYIFFNRHDAIALKGWAIPAATDIAFALGVLILLGDRIPASLKVFLIALSILDDLGAIIIIAAFYTTSLWYLPLLFALLCIGVLLILNLWQVRVLLPYILVGVILWFCFLHSGIHATLSGVILAALIPVNTNDNTYSPAIELEKFLHPLVAFLVLPIFAFFNAGISFQVGQLTLFTHGITLGIAAGLFFGKPIGIILSSWLGVKLGLTKVPRGLNWYWIGGVSIVCGIGFTMSLFIGTLAFNTTAQQNEVLVRMGVLSGSLLSGVVGYLVLHFYSKNHSFGRPLRN